jgi:hypothetical protein
VEAVVKNVSEATAAVWLAENYPQHKGEDLCISWCVKNNYITFEGE